MTQPAQAPATAPLNVQAAPVPAAPPEVATRSTPSQRAAVAMARLEKLEAAPESAGEGEASQPSSFPSSPADSGAASKPAPDEAAEQRKADRLTRISQLRAKEDAANRERLARAPRARASDGELETLRKQIAELEPIAKVGKDPFAILEWAEKNGVPAPDMVKALRERTTDPEAVAARQTRTVEQTLRAEIEALRKDVAAAETKRAEETKLAQEQAYGQRRAAEFRAKVVEHEANYPLTAALQKSKGHDLLVGLANEWVAPHLPQDYSLDTLHDHLEQLLEELQVGGLAPSAGPRAPLPKNDGAAQPAITLNNRTTAGRETVVEEKPLHRMSKAERVRLARDKYERE